MTHSFLLQQMLMRVEVKRNQDLNKEGRSTSFYDYSSSDADGTFLGRMIVQVNRHAFVRE